MSHSFNTSDSTITVEVNGQSVTLPLDSATDFVMEVIAARKLGYATKKENRSAEIAARKEKAAAKKAEKAKAAAKRKADRIKRLKKQLADLEKAEKKAA